MQGVPRAAPGDPMARSSARPLCSLRWRIVDEPVAGMPSQKQIIIRDDLGDVVGKC